MVYSRSVRQGSGSGSRPLSTLAHPPPGRKKQPREFTCSACVFRSLSKPGPGAAGDSRGFRGASGRPLPKCWGDCGCSHGYTGSSRKDPPCWPGHPTHPPQLGSRASPDPAQIRRRGTGCHRVAPEIPSLGPGGARAERAETLPAESDAPGGAEAAAAARPPSAPLPGTPRKHPLEKNFGGFSSEGAGGVSGSSDPPWTKGLSWTRSLQISRQTDIADGVAVW